MLSCAASVAQLEELLICNQWVGGSSPFAGSISNVGQRLSKVVDRLCQFNSCHLQPGFLGYGQEGADYA
jgi:hypothetical protein